MPRTGPDVIADPADPVATLRRDIVDAIQRTVTRPGWTPAYAAERMGVAQEQVDELLRGYYEHLSTDVLVAMAWGVSVNVRAIQAP
jgi:predicted XRE-type DNA-binding protein